VKPGEPTALPLPVSVGFVTSIRAPVQGMASTEEHSQLISQVTGFPARTGWGVTTVIEMDSVGPTAFAILAPPDGSNAIKSTRITANVLIAGVDLHTCAFMVNILLTSLLLIQPLERGFRPSGFIRESASVTRSVSEAEISRAALEALRKKRPEPAEGEGHASRSR